MARILVIDDDELSRNIVADILIDEGHAVEAVTEGREGITLHRADPVDLIVTDLLMPGMEGIETIQELRKREPNPKIIAMSSGHRENLAIAKALGATSILAKPFSRQQLLKCVQECLGKE
jgi:CheY-like chemotaxis protein